MRTRILDTNPPAGDDLDGPSGPLVPAALESTEVIPASARSTHPVAVYLARLAPGSRRTMRQALDVVASHGDAQLLKNEMGQLRAKAP